MREKLFDRCPLDHPPGVHHQHPVAEAAHQVDIVADKYQPQPARLHQIVEQAEDLQTDPVRTLRAGQRERLERVRRYLHDDPSHAHSLVELARLACMSPSSLRRHFAQQYGSSVFDYLHEQRMRHAEQGLRKDGWTVEQAAAASGYRHPSNFAAAFRKRFGLVPSRWRTGPSKVE